MLKQHIKIISIIIIIFNCSFSIYFLAQWFIKRTYIWLIWGIFFLILTAVTLYYVVQIIRNYNEIPSELFVMKYQKIITILGILSLIMSVIAIMLYIIYIITKSKQSQTITQNNETVQTNDQPSGIVIIESFMELVQTNTLYNVIHIKFDTNLQITFNLLCQWATEKINDWEVKDERFYSFCKRIVSLHNYEIQPTNTPTAFLLSLLTLLQPIRQNFKQFVQDLSVCFISDISNRLSTLYFVDYRFFDPLPANIPLFSDIKTMVENDIVTQLFDNIWMLNAAAIRNWLLLQTHIKIDPNSTVKQIMYKALNSLEERVNMYQKLYASLGKKLVTIGYKPEEKKFNNFVYTKSLDEQKKFLVIMEQALINNIYDEMDLQNKVLNIDTLADFLKKLPKSYLSGINNKNFPSNISTFEALKTAMQGHIAAQAAQGGSYTL